MLIFFGMISMCATLKSAVKSIAISFDIIKLTNCLLDAQQIVVPHLVGQILDHLVMTDLNQSYNRRVNRLFNSAKRIITKSTPIAQNMQFNLWAWAVWRSCMADHSDNNNSKGG